MTIVSEFRAGLSPLLNLVYPPRCPVCGVSVAEHGGLCLDCWNQLEWSPTSGAAADLSIQQDPIIAACLYNDISRDLILQFKHGGKIGHAQLMARMMAASLGEGVSEAPRAIVPVPLHRLRLWQRGYNQSALLARELAKYGEGEPVIDGLIRTKRTPSLGGLSQEERKRALSGAIAVSKSRAKAFAGKDILLVDDVYTSGATTSACVEALSKAGAKSVLIVCFARVAP
ncbi:MAG: ComF family protein [Pseudomonadota bacterium]